MNSSFKRDTDYKSIASDVSKEYFNVPDLLGVIWIGSTSYGICDQLADIDIRLVCDDEDNEFEMKQFEKGGIKVEVDKATIQWLLQKTDPDTEQFWIREKAQILYDPQNMLKKKFIELNRCDKKTYKKILIRLYKELFQSYNFEKTTNRNDVITSWMLIFKALNALSKFCFIYHDKPVPTFRWRWYFIKKDKLLEPSLIKEIELFDSKNSQQTFSLLETIEQEARQMMLIKGYPEKFVKKPWLLYNHFGSEKERYNNLKLSLNFFCDPDRIRTGDSLAENQMS